MPGATDNAGSAALSTPPRDKRDAALDIAVKALRDADAHFEEIATKALHWMHWGGIKSHAWHRAAECKKALLNIDSLLGKGEGR
jgi:hypothetical protein